MRIRIEVDAGGHAGGVRAAAADCRTRGTARQSFSQAPQLWASLERLEQPAKLPLQHAGVVNPSRRAVVTALAAVVNIGRQIGASERRVEASTAGAWSPQSALAPQIPQAESSSPRVDARVVAAGLFVALPTAAQSHTRNGHGRSRRSRRSCRGRSTGRRKSPHRSVRVRPRSTEYDSVGWLERKQSEKADLARLAASAVVADRVVVVALDDRAHVRELRRCPAWGPE